MTLAAGTRLGPYEIVAPLGAGGMGEVYRAKDPRLGREVAIKVLPPEFATDAERLARFEQEARAASALNHPNILTVHDFGVQDAKAYLVTELLDGASLRERLTENEPVALKSALDWAVQAAHGLAAAHEKGIVHRDLKPENLFVTRDGRVKILDFGLAKLALPESSGSLLSEGTTLAGATATGTVMGTVGYMAPEQVRGERVDARADLFSFGCVVFEMIAGRRAFRGATPADTLSAILRDEPPVLDPDAPARIPPALAALVARCLEKDPARRFRSAEDLAWALETLRVGSSTAAAPRPAAARRRLPWPTIGIAALAAALGAVVLSRFTPHAASVSTLERLTFERGRISGARFAPGGKEVVLTASWGTETPRLFLKRSESLAALPLETRDAKLLAVSRSGELALLLRPRVSGPFGQTGTLARQSLGGGAPREVFDSIAAADWHPGSGELAIVIDEGDAERLEFPPGKVRHRAGGWISQLRFSPDGQRLAFLEHPVRDSMIGNLVVLDLATGAHRTLTKTEGNTDLLGLAWHPKGRELWFGDDIGRLQAVDLDGRARIVATYPLPVLVSDFDGDGRLLFSQEDRRMGMQVEDDATGRVRELSWLRWSVLFDLSRAGDRVLFTEFTERWAGTGRAALRGTDGGPVVELADGMAFDLSPDEQTAVVIVQSEPSRLLLVPIGAGSVRELERGPVVAHSVARIAPDGRRIVFVGRTASSGFRLYVQELAGGPPRQLSEERMGFGLLSISPDGEQVAAVGADGALRIFPIGGGPSRVVPGAQWQGSMLSFSEDGRSLLVRKLGGFDISIQRLDATTGVASTVRDLHPPDPIGFEFVGPIVTTPDERVWAYTYLRTLSTLYVAKGLPER